MPLQDVWARAAGYDPAGVRSVPMGPVLIRPVPCNMSVAFNDGTFALSCRVGIPSCLFETMAGGAVGKASA